MQREREINDIAKGIIGLADIFKDLQTMIIDQGTMLDRVDYNVEKMAEHVKGAEKELVVVSISFECPGRFLARLTHGLQATGYQKKNSKRKIIFFLLLLVVGMFILLLVKPKRQRSPAVVEGLVPDISTVSFRREQGTFPRCNRGPGVVRWIAA